MFGLNKWKDVVPIYWHMEENGGEIDFEVKVRNFKHTKLQISSEDIKVAGGYMILEFRGKVKPKDINSGVENL